MGNDWSRYATPAGMGYVNSGMTYQTVPVNPVVQQQLKEQEDHTIKVTAACCTISMLAGIAAGVYIGKQIKRHRDEEFCSSHTSSFHDSFD